MNLKKTLPVLALVSLLAVGGATQIASAATIKGTVDNVTSNQITVEGLTILTDNNTKIEGIIAPGVLVKIKTTTLNGSPVAVKIEAKGDDDGDNGKHSKFTRFKGTATNVTATSLVINGQTIKINEATKIKGNLAIGAKIKVKAITQSDGSLLAVKVKVYNPKVGWGKDRDDEDGEID